MPTNLIEAIVNITTLVDGSSDNNPIRKDWWTIRQALDKLTVDQEDVDATRIACALSADEIRPLIKDNEIAKGALQILLTFIDKAYPSNKTRKPYELTAEDKTNALLQNIKIKTFLEEDKKTPVPPITYPLNQI
jgi:hypothetical protein